MPVHGKYALMNSSSLVNLPMRATTAVWLSARFSRIASSSVP